MDKFEILTVNARGLNSDEKRTKLYAWLHDIQTDIIFVQETHFIEKDVLKYDARWLGKSYCLPTNVYLKIKFGVMNKIVITPNFIFK